MSRPGRRPCVCSRTSGRCPRSGSPAPVRSCRARPADTQVRSASWQCTSEATGQAYVMAAPGDVVPRPETAMGSRASGPGFDSARAGRAADQVSVRVTAEGDAKQRSQQENRQANSISRTAYPGRPLSRGIIFDAAGPDGAKGNGHDSAPSDAPGTPWRALPDSDQPKRGECQ